MFHLNTYTIKQAAISKGFSAAELAKRAEISVELAENIFIGRGDRAKLFDFKPLARLATALNLKPSALIQKQIAF